MFEQFDEKGKIFTNVISKQPVYVHIQTDKQFIKGTVHIRPDDRLKDELNQPELFIAVTDATIFNLEGKLIKSVSFLAVNRNHIVWLLQDDEIIDSKDA